MDIDTKRLRELLEAATPGGGWISERRMQGAQTVTIAVVGDYIVGIRTPGIPGGNYRDADLGPCDADAELIAAAVNALPALLDKAEAYDALRARVEGAPVGAVIGGRANSFGGFHVEIAHDAGWAKGQRVALVKVEEPRDDGR